MYSWKLEIEKYKENILKRVEKNKTTIIKGPTGCGKSTYVPLLFKDKKVAIIEPRRIAVLGLYNVLKNQVDNLGYKMRFNKVKVDEEKAHMVIFTDGAFLAEMDLDFDIIIVDEVHERSVRTDLLLFMLKLKFKNKLILMSATLETTTLEKYFNTCLIDIKCKSYKVKEIYVEKPVADYITAIYLTIKRIIIENKEDDERKDVLVFLPGVDDINDLFKLIKKQVGVKPYKVFSAMEEHEQIEIFKSTTERKIILATNICETSLTIPTVKYVIDTGLAKTKIFDGISHLGIQKITAESEKQREGRCNRLGNGVCYKMYTKDMEFMAKVPEFQQSDMSHVFLFLLKNKIDLTTAKFLNYPPVKNIRIALEFLKEKKCIEIECKEESETKPEITTYGKRLLQHPFDVNLANFYECAISKNFAYFGSIIVALISLENYNFMQYKEKTQKTDLEWLIYIFEEYKKAEDKYDCCKKYDLPVKGMKNAHKIFKTLKRTNNNITLEDFEKLFSNCFAHNKCIRQKDGSYKVEKTGEIAWIHPSSPFFKRNTQKIVVVDFFCTSKTYCRIIGKYYGA